SHTAVFVLSTFLSDRMGNRNWLIIAGTSYVREGSLDPFQCHQSIYGNLPRWTRAPETFIDAEAGSEVEVDHRADIYALGATLHQMVTGQRPFPAISDPHLRNAQSQTSLKLPPQLANR
ncbi:hypothetical protein C2W62_51560, partial [Candidatus Entotheonella serta]